MKQSVAAVLDIGKTNKKVSLYDRGFAILATERTVLETADRDGLEIERTDDLLRWFTQTLAAFSKEYDIRAISVTTHGATCALLAEDGSLAYPVLSYTSEKGAEVQEAFYATFGERDALHRATGTADFGFANLAKSLFYVKTRLPEAWARCRHIVFYPQYIGHLLTGRRGMEPTYLGNHSYLWDIAHNRWSAVAQGLGVEDKFPEKLSAPWESLGRVRPDIAVACGLPEDCAVTVGIHDSNANFLPYLAQGHRNYILNSTGTWCVGMRHADSPELSDEEIRQKVFFNLDAFNRPVKTCIFPAGMEYDAFTSLTREKDCGDPEALASLVRDKDLFVMPGVLPDACIFSGAAPRVIHGDRTHSLKDLRQGSAQPLTRLGQRYLAAINASLAIQTREMLFRCGASKGTHVFIEGGFSRNAQYCELLAALCPDCTIALTNLREGTSMGAALLAWMVLDHKDLAAIGRGFSIETRRIVAGECGDLEGYERAFRAHLDA
ncbi:MAG TPA: FGGY family carbohydrate kinase [Candidatus Hydrogenedentes bacterium]|nr:FGGY family carbohydrate kinase [Candidatus Hydrogenedentota bacterium]